MNARQAKLDAFLDNMIPKLRIEVLGVIRKALLQHQGREGRWRQEREESKRLLRELDVLLIQPKKVDP